MNFYDLLIVIVIVSIAACGWFVPQIAPSYRKLIAIVVGALVLLWIVGFFTTQGKTDYAFLTWALPIALLGFGILAGGCTQLWVLLRRDGVGPHISESRIRLFSAGASIVALLLLNLSR